MAVYNTASDAANTAVRAFLTEIGEFYWGKPFNTGSGQGKEIWLKIKNVVFDNRCAYCGSNDPKLQIDHVIMFNRVGFGLHHPGNIIPACSVCNKRSRNETSAYNTWDLHLLLICNNNDQKNLYKDRYNKIKNHLEKGEYKYPDLSIEEQHALKIITNNLYESVKNEFVQAVKLFEDLNAAYTKKIT